MKTLFTLSEVNHPYVRGSKTKRPYIVGYGCDGSTDNNIHYIAQKMVKLLGWDYHEIYLKAYEWQHLPDQGNWITEDLGDSLDEAMGIPVWQTTIIPANTTIQMVLDDLYEINNRSLAGELEERFEKAGIPLDTRLTDLKKGGAYGKKD